MVIQSNMTPKAIVDIWENTEEIFKKYEIPIAPKMLQELVPGDILPELLSKLNNSVGSSSVTCTEGG